ncbi:MAG TPA: hypothetical protein VD837_14495 [Terriglobales bacterium]|nr:hypothetical protein [Terriglobales bacterium]
MKRLRVLLVLASLVFVAVVTAQNTPASAPKVDGAGDFSGMYEFLQEGEFLQINLEEQGRVTGYISRFGDGASDKGAFLTQFLKAGTTDGTKVEFTTEPVHGTWFEFDGTVTRDAAKTPEQQGQFVLAGKLTKLTKDQRNKTSGQSREVKLLSFPQDAGMEPPKNE